MSIRNREDSSKSIQAIYLCIRGCWLRDRIPILLLAITLLIMSYPLVFHLHDHLPMNNVDTYQILWQNWWVFEALKNGLDINQTPLLFHPTGLDITVMHPRWSTLPLLTPLYLLFGDPFAHNLTALLGLFFKAYGMYLVGLNLFGRRIPAWVCGAFYAYCAPSLNMALSDPMTGATEWIPWFMLLLLQGMSRIRAGHGGRKLWIMMAVAGLLFAFNFYTNIKIGIFASLLCGGFLLLVMVAQRLWLNRMFWAGLLVFGVSAIVFTSPLLTTLLGSSELGGAIEFAVESDSKGGIDLLSYFKADHFRPLNYRQSIASLSGDQLQMTVVAWGLSHVGVVSFVFAGMGALNAFRVCRSASTWVILASVFCLLSFGVVIHLQRQPLDIPWTLYGLLQDFAPLHILRWPFRVVFVFVFPFSILIGYGVHYRLRNLTFDRTQGTLLTFSVIALLYGTSIVPIPVRPLEQPTHLQALEELQPGAIIDVPFGRQSSRYYMSLQRDHRRPIIEGFISRNPLHAFVYIESNALLAAMRALDTHERLPMLEEWQADLDQLAEDGFRYIVLHREVPVRQQHIPILPEWIWEMFAPAIPAYEDDNVRIYDIKALYQPETPIYQANEFGVLMVEKGETIQVGNTFVLHAWMPLVSTDAQSCQSISIESWWQLQARDRTPHSLSLILADPSGSTQIAISDAVPADRFTNEWKPDRFYRDQTDLRIPCDTEPGKYPLFLAMKETTTGAPLAFRYPNGESIGTLYYLTTFNVDTN